MKSIIWIIMCAFVSLLLILVIVEVNKKNDIDKLIEMKKSEIQIKIDGFHEANLYSIIEFCKSSPQHEECEMFRNNIRECTENPELFFCDDIKVDLNFCRENHLEPLCDMGELK